MTDVKFSAFVAALDALTSPALTDYWPIMDDEATDVPKKVALSDVKELFDVSGIAANTETLSATLTLTDASEVIQFIDPGGADRDIELPAEASTNHPFIISNQADAAETLTVSDDGATEVDTVAQGETKLFVSDGTSWAALSGGSGGGDGTVLPSTNEGRLTLETGVPESSTDQTEKATLYFTPFIGNLIALYSGTAWELIEFSELSLDISGYTANKNYDIFVYNNSGTVTLEGLIWTDDTTRATALVRQDGVLSKTGALTRRYVGTIRITASAGECEDSKTKRYVYNAQNQKKRALFKSLTATHTYNAEALRVWNNDAAARVDMVIGDLSTISIMVAGTVKAGAASKNAYFGASTDGTNLDTEIGYVLNSNAEYISGAGAGEKQLAAGLRTVYCLQSGDATNAAGFTQMQIKGSVLG